MHEAYTNTVCTSAPYTSTIKDRTNIVAEVIADGLCQFFACIFEHILAHVFDGC